MNEWRQFVVFAFLTRLAHSEPIHWRINLPDNVQQQQVQTSTGISFSLPIPAKDTDQSKIRLVDFREWSRMRPAYSATIGAPPLLIVDTDSVVDAPSRSTIPEAMLDEPETTTLELTTSKAETTTSILATTSTSAPSTTTQSVQTTTTNPDTTTPEDEFSSTTPKANPDVTLELRNLPDILALLKHLSLIPAVVRSFSSAAMPTGASHDGQPNSAPSPFGSLISAASNQQPNSDLRSRALSANSGYNARSPQFVTAMPTESESPQVFMGRRPVQQLNPNMPAPIVPVNGRQEMMRPKEVMSSQRNINQFPAEHRLNIYGIDARRGENALSADRDPAAYNAPMIQPPPQVNSQPTNGHKQRPRFDLSNLTVNEVEQLESIHRKLFQQPRNLPTNEQKVIENRNELIIHTPQQQPSPLPLTEQVSQPLHVFQKPPNNDVGTNSNLAQQIMSTQSTFNSSALRPEMISELMMIKDIPDLEELTKGMDLSLLSRPGGFALLKEQFIERLIQRTLVQKQMLRRKLRRNHRQRHRRSQRVLTN